MLKSICRIVFVVQVVTIVFLSYWIYIERCNNNRLKNNVAKLAQTPGRVYADYYSRQEHNDKVAGKNIQE